MYKQLLLNSNGIMLEREEETLGKLMQEVYEKEKALELAIEVEAIALETNLNINAATRLIIERYKKTHSLSDQTIENEQMKLLKNIITDKMKK